MHENLTLNVALLAAALATALILMQALADLLLHRRPPDPSPDIAD